MNFQTINYNHSKQIPRKRLINIKTMVINFSRVESALKPLWNIKED